MFPIQVEAQLLAPKQNDKTNWQQIANESTFRRPSDVTVEKLSEDYRQTQLKLEQSLRIKIKTIKKAGNAINRACSCVAYTLARMGIGSMGLGSAKNYPVNSKIPVIGGYVVFYGGKDGHMGFVTAVNGKNFTYDEGNANYHCLIRLGTMGVVGQGNIKGFGVY